MGPIARRTMILAAAASAALALAACGGAKDGAASAEGDMSMGRADAPVTVVEYASVTCSHCAAWNEEVFPAFKAKYIDTGQVRYVFREFPTAPAQVAAAGFLVARCAGDDKYFQVVDAIMRGQRAIFEGDARGVLLRTAQSAGMTEEQFNACVTDEKALQALNKRVEAGVKAGVQSTPSFVVNGKMYEGAQPLAALDAAIAEAKKTAS
ncbi:MAG TPA: DsbA family protein [Caulobacteraceae bacterium]|nr:DsbA family protein [Caulobacteraceae bacterium]